MPAAAAPYGLRASYHPSGLIRPHMLRMSKALMEATPTLFMGTPVALDTSGRLAVAANGSDFCGVFSGVEFTDLLTGRPVVANNWQNGVTVKDMGVDSARVYFTIDPTIRFQINATGPLAASAVGDQINFDANIAAGNTTTGLSTAGAATLVGAGVQGMLRIVDLVHTPDNEWTDAFPDIVVEIARHQFVAGKVAV